MSHTKPPYIAPVEIPATPAPTPRTDAATAGVDFFITDSDQRAYSATDYECLRDEMKKLERELSAARAEVDSNRLAADNFASALMLARGDAMRYSAECERLREALQPCRMQDGPPIPRYLAEAIYAGYAAQFGKSQSLDRLLERGGFGWDEVAALWKLPAVNRATTEALAATRKEEGNV